MPIADNVVRDKSKAFALRIIKLYRYLCDDKREYVISRQLLKCGTSIGANICEAIHSMSKREFIAKMNISLEEAAETEYWLELLCESRYIRQKEFDSIITDCSEVKSLLTSIIKTSNKDKK